MENNNQGTKKMMVIDPEVIQILDPDAVSKSKIEQQQITNWTHSRSETALIFENHLMYAHYKGENKHILLSNRNIYMCVGIHTHRHTKCYINSER